jgi:hypothetical protein
MVNTFWKLKTTQQPAAIYVYINADVLISSCPRSWLETVFMSEVNISFSR